jgi:hypothetical protein
VVELRLRQFNYTYIALVLCPICVPENVSLKKKIIFPTEIRFERNKMQPAKWRETDKEREQIKMSCKFSSGLKSKDA